jgi:cytochrome c-type biogenesis protein CcmE
MKGRMNGEVFECNEIVLKCPSKYKDNPSGQMKAYNAETAGSQEVSAQQVQP